MPVKREVKNAVRLTEQIYLKNGSQFEEICKIARQIYNDTNYLKKQEYNEFKRVAWMDTFIRFIFQGQVPQKMKWKWLSAIDLYHLVKERESFHLVPNDCATMIIRQVSDGWIAFFRAKREWRKHPEKFNGMPKPPRYKKRTELSIFYFRDKQCRIKEGALHFPRRTQTELVNKLSPIETRLPNGIEVRQVRVIPIKIRPHYKIEIVYEKKITNLELNKDRCIGIDLGVSNIIMVVNNVGNSPFFIKGGPGKSINQFYNKRRADLSSINDKQKHKFQTHQLQKLTHKRNMKMKWWFHNISKQIITYCTDHNIGTIVIGYNKGWKQEIQIGKRNNQNFVSIPFYQLLQQIEYKARLIGIEVKQIEESYTSKCSFFDQEEIKYHKTYRGERISRGLFRTSNGKIINADVNGAYNILRKGIPEAFVDGIEGALSHPYSSSVPYQTGLKRIK